MSNIITLPSNMREREREREREKILKEPTIDLKVKSVHLKRLSQLLIWAFFIQVKLGGDQCWPEQYEWVRCKENTSNAGLIGALVASQISQ